MDPNPPKFRLDARLQQTGTDKLQRLGQQHPGQQFDSVEAMLRHDRNQIPLPGSLGSRLDASLARLPVRKPWWRRLFGG